MAARKFSKKELPLIQEKITRLDLQGWNERDIATEIGCSQQLVSYHLKRLREERIARTGQNLEEKRQHLLDAEALVRTRFWQIDENSPCPKIQAKALSQVQKSHSMIAKWQHLDRIEPLANTENELINETPEALAKMFMDVLGETGESGPGNDSPAVDSESETPFDALSLDDLPSCDDFNSETKDSSQNGANKTTRSKIAKSKRLTLKEKSEL